MSRKGPASRITFLLEPELKSRFERACAERDVTCSQALRRLIKAHLHELGGKPAGRAPPEHGR